MPGYTGQILYTEDGVEYRPPIRADEFPPAPPQSAAPGASFSFTGGTVLAGLIDGALAGQMGKPAMQLLLFQISEALALYDGGYRSPYPRQIGNLPPFEAQHSEASQIARLRSAKTQLTTLTA